MATLFSQWMLSAMVPLLCCSALAQSQTNPMLASPVDPSNDITADSTSHVTTIITKVPYQGKSYFIKIAPLDSTLIDNMRQFNPEGRRVFIWRYSLQHHLPDSLLQHLSNPQKRKREN